MPDPKEEKQPVEYVGCVDYPVSTALDPFLEMHIRAIVREELEAYARRQVLQIRQLSLRPGMETK